MRRGRRRRRPQGRGGARPRGRPGRATRRGAREGLGAGRAERLGEPGVRVVRALDEPGQGRGGERVLGVGPEAESRDEEQPLERAGGLGAGKGRFEAFRGERGGDRGALLVHPAEDGDVARPGTTDLARGAVADARLGILEERADARGRLGGIASLVLRAERPPLDDRAETRRLVGISRDEADAGLGEPLPAEGADEELGGDVDERGPAAPGLRERLRLVASEEGLDGGVHEPRIGAAETVDGLLLVAHPGALREPGEREEERELEGARVLELVDEDEVDLGRELFADGGPLEEPEGEGLLVGEVDDAALALVVGVGREGASGERKGEASRASEFTPETRVPVVVCGERPGRGLRGRGTSCPSRGWRGR